MNPGRPALPYDCPEAMNPPPGTSWAALLKQIPDGAVVLDVGCSSGSFAVAMKRKACRVIGVELNPAAAEAAQSRCDQVHVGDIGTLLASDILPSAAFDVVLAADVLEHLVDPVPVVRACRRLLRAHGFMLTSLPNVTHAAVILEMCQGRFPKRPEGLLDATHLHFFGEDSALALFTDAGYRATVVDRIRRDPRNTEFASRLQTLPDDFLTFLDQNPNADTYQFIIRAAPSLDDDALPVATAPAPAEPLRNTLVREATELRSQLREYHEAAVAHEGALATLDARLRTYHEALVAKDAEIAILHQEVGRYHEAATAREEHLARLNAQTERAQERHRQREMDVRALVRGLTPLSALRVLYVTDGWDAPYRYRCAHAIEQLRVDGVAANVMHIDDPMLLPALRSYSIVVLFRLPWSPRVEEVIGWVRGQRATLIFDIDDLIFDEQVQRLLPFFSSLAPDSQRAYLELFPRLRRTLDACDYFIGSTPALARHAQGLGKEAFVHPNLVSEEYIRASWPLRAARRLLHRSPTVAYFSGSDTHDPDLAMIGGSLARVLDEDPAVRMLLCGFVNVPDVLAPFASRILCLPYQDWRVYPWTLARCRATVAPVSVVNEFTNGKSALKFLEAGVFGVCTVATPIESCGDAITDGENGFLAASEDEWYEKIRLALDPERARLLGERARETVLNRFSFAAWRGRLRSLLHPLLGQAPGPVPSLLPTDPELRAASPARRMGSRLRRARRRLSLLSETAPSRSSRTFVLKLPDTLGRTSRTVTPLEPAPFEALLASVRRHGPRWVRDCGPVVLEVATAADLEGWTSLGEVRSWGSGRYESHGSDPRLIGPLVCIPGGDFRYVVLRMAVTASTQAAAQLFWSADHAPDFSEQRSLRWHLDPHGDWRTYVIDLAGSEWMATKNVTRLRLDPLDCEGSIEIDRITLLADLGQLAPGRDLRRALSERYLHGRGVECGALQNPLAVPSDARVHYVDRLTEEQARAHYPELHGQRLVRPSVIGDVGKLPIRDRTLDFCVANHLLEHARDPIGGLKELLRVLRPDGKLFVSVPDVDNPLDRRRPVTSLAHLLEDHEGATDRTADDLIHYHESITSAHPGLDEAQLRELIERHVAQGYSVHFHTFDEASYRQLLSRVCLESGAAIEEFARNAQPEYDEYIAIVRPVAEGRSLPRYLPPSARRTCEPPGVDIVVPIYNAREATVQCIQSVLQHARGDWRLVLVDDASTDSELAGYLDEIARIDQRVRLLRNNVNVGFVGSANRGMREAGSRDVLLLNSDTVVSAEFLHRLQTCTYADEATGVVSPLSNNATICSVPEFCQANPIPFGFTIETFAALVTQSSLHLRPELVTAVGFCMYVRATVLATIGYFDEESFPRGYGEENDFCERALAAGFGVRLADDVFVYHAGEASFGAEGAERRRTNREVMERLHPDFFAKVARFVEQNPLAPIHDNITLAMQRRAATQPALLVLLHASVTEPDGGSEHHVRDLIRTARLPRVVVAVPESEALQLIEVLDGNLDTALAYSLPLAKPPERLSYERADFDGVLRTVVRLFGVAAVHIHHLLNWPITSWRTFANLQIPFLFTAHDFYCVCPNPNLTDIASGRPCCAAAHGPPADRSACMQSLFGAVGLPALGDAHRFVERHLSEFSSLLGAARWVIFPSSAARDLVSRFHVLDPERTRVVPHGYRCVSTRPERRTAAGPVRIAVLGAVAYPIKGAREILALMDRTRHLPLEWHVFGNTEKFGYGEALDSLGLGRRLVLHGTYDRNAIVEQLAAAAVDLAVMLPICPETFSFTLSEALLAGVPAIVADQGALSERVGDSQLGVVVRTVGEAAEAIERLVNNRDQLRRLQDATADFRHRSLEEMGTEYRDIYSGLLAGVRSPEPLGLQERRQLVSAYQRTKQLTRSRSLQPTPTHYTRWWYPIYARLAAPLVPARVRRWARAWVGLRPGRTVRRVRFGRTNGEVMAAEGLELLHAGRRASTYRVLNADPSFQLGLEPFPTSSIREIRFRMRCQASGFLFAQLYWAHGAEEHFSETKSLQIPLQTDGESWHEYVVRIDDADRRDLWDSGDVIHHLRFDPVNAPGTIALRELRLCSRRS